MSICIHCDEVSFHPLFEDTDTIKAHPFCCRGCMTVFQVLHQKGLESYYDIKLTSGLMKPRSPVDTKNSQFHYLDDTEFRKEYSYEDSSQLPVMEFYLEGIHCLACLWLIEKIPEFVPGVVTAKLDLSRSVVTVTIVNGGEFREVARELNNLGYTPHALRKNQDETKLKAREEKINLIRIGIAGAAAGNIMVYAISLYGGADGSFAQYFNMLTVLFAIPVLTFCAYPFYKNAYFALKNKTLSIDIPISLALVTGGAMGIHHLISGISENYFDSLSTLVFLLLLSRYFLAMIQERGLSANDLQYFHQNESVLQESVFGSGIFEETHQKFVKAGHRLKIRPGEFIPADGIVIAGDSHVNKSLLSGEAYPSRSKVGDEVFSGTQNLENELLILAQKTHSNTKLGSILKEVENARRHSSDIVDLTHRISKYFTFVVLFLSLSLFMYLFSTADFNLAFQRAVTLLIVTCPCALALAIPFTFTQVLSKAAQRGMIIKSDSVIERVSKVKTVFIDKTGTITLGKLQIKNFEMISPSLLPLGEVIYNLEKNSRHPVALALLEMIPKDECRSHEVQGLVEIIGQGVFGTINSIFYEIKNLSIFENNKMVAKFSVEDSIRKDARENLVSILKQKIDLRILTGDSKKATEDLLSKIRLPLHTQAEMDPHQKAETVKKNHFTMMVGDGANDAIALREADVGVAVVGAMDISLRAADVYLTRPGLGGIVDLILLSRETMKVVKRNIFLSLSYNSLSVFAVFSGHISPLVAAIIMPLSSLTVLISSIVGTKKMRALWKS